MTKLLGNILTKVGWYLDNSYETLGQYFQSIVSILPEDYHYILYSFPNTIWILFNYHQIDVLISPNIVKIVYAIVPKIVQIKPKWCTNIFQTLSINHPNIVPCIVKILALS